MSLYEPYKIEKLLAQEKFSALEFFYEKSSMNYYILADKMSDKIRIKVHVRPGVENLSCIMEYSTIVNGEQKWKIISPSDFIERCSREDIKLDIIMNQDIFFDSSGLIKWRKTDHDLSNISKII